MIIKAAKNCIEKLTVDRESAAQITERNSSIVLTSVPLRSDHVE